VRDVHGMGVGKENEMDIGETEKASWGEGE
jgi:hypothetical protein